MYFAYALKRLACACIAATVVVACPGYGLAAAGRASLQSLGTPSVAAVAATLTSDGDKTQLVVTLSREVTARAFLMERPDRVIVDLPEVNFHLPPEVGRHRRGVVSSFRYGLFAPGRSRIVVDLAQLALVSRIDVVDGEDNVALLQIEFTRTDRQTFRKAAETLDSEAGRALRAAAPANRPDPRPLIVLDAGHGGIDPGAIAAGGAHEKDIVFGFAARLRRRLEGTGRYRVLMTRDHDVFVPLDERVRIAREAKADLFVSIHADSISAAPHVRGLTVYTGSEQASDTESQRLADRENKADAAAGLDLEANPGDVADILQDLTLRETRSFSQRFAHKLVGAIDPVMPLSKKPQRQAAFRVLRAPDVPSVLVELGYLSSREDIDLLLSESWRDRSTAAMAAAIERFFAPRIASQRPAPVSP
jgi:N-acetylmuramoyl-L-alanine amidase